MIKIIFPIDNTPAAEAGIKAGDLIVEVDGVPVRGIKDKLRGEKGTSIDLVVLGTIVRDTIQLSSVRKPLPAQTSSVILNRLWLGSKTRSQT